MALLNTLFGKKKKEFKATCQITKEPIERGFGYLLTTAQVVTSKKYWDMIMTEPETLSYTVSHFKNQATGTQMRSMIFEKYATIAKAWIVSDSIINYFDVDKTTARELAKKWWESEGNFTPENIGPASQTLEAREYTDLKDYAILEAGRSRVAV
ncbi:MAG: hypothetical protein BroJett042_15620 [Bacteroidota bacterium]|nr:MAG: hypothetical protein UZ12_BCD005000589 [Bacteroidetes bacterium OLB12]QLH34346.1 MAG: hypothetical protein HWD62_19800 [Cyclobacteriaceae bacterium]GIL23049.1 MAG: hypothetical protein BroJett042_15620 [Bacteroidota bacterium]HNU43028.1 hypothetical protein [Cyclobacteriaceae bacterium]